MSERLDTSFLDDALDDALAFATRDAKHTVADALACHLHNDGYALEGNTETNDLEWFARTLWAEEMREMPTNWGKLPDVTRERYRRAAGAVIRALPAFQLRVAHRLITLSKVTRDIERAMRAQAKAGSA
jgi:hypothetical protein